MMPDSYQARLDLLPPPVCWVLARRNRRPILMSEIARHAGVSERWLREILQRPSWAGVTVELADRIRAACGITPQNETRHLEYLRRTLSGDSNATLFHLRFRNAKSRAAFARAIGAWQADSLQGAEAGSLEPSDLGNPAALAAH